MFRFLCFDIENFSHWHSHVQLQIIVDFHIPMWTIFIFVPLSELLYNFFLIIVIIVCSNIYFPSILLFTLISFAFVFWALAVLFLRFRSFEIFAHLLLFSFSIPMHIITSIYTYIHTRTRNLVPHSPKMNRIFFRISNCCNLHQLNIFYSRKMQMNFYDRQKHIFAGGTQFVLRFFFGHWCTKKGKTWRQVMRNVKDHRKKLLWSELELGAFFFCRCTKSRDASM